jgi:DNA-binding MarR family transcriptional regulator
MSRLGFGPGQFFFLAELFRADGLSQDELSRRVGVDKSNTSRALARLEAYGLVRREGDAGNHRVKRVYLEPEAHKLKKTFSNIQHRWNAMLLNGFSTRRKTEILAAMETINTNAAKVFLEQGDIEPPETECQNELKWK